MKLTDRQSTERAQARKVLPCLALLAALLAACSGPKANQTSTLSTPDGATFPPVSDALEVRCGTLDCHGSIYRNLRMYGIYGVRADPKDITGTGATTADEYERNYLSFIGLEPEALSALVRSHAQGIEHFIVITKGTNAEEHKGGQRMKKGDPAYQCLTSWIAGTIDMNACDAASAITPPGGDAF